MAKIYSHSESRAKGSVGMTTYRTVRGKVIQSQKISPWDPAVEAVGGATRWNERTALLGIISLWCSAHAQSIINSFNRTKNGSQRNYFMKKNYAALKAAFYNLSVAYAASKVAPAIQEIENALGSYAALHANTIYRIKKSGYDIVFLSNNWNDSDDPVTPPTIDSMNATLDGDYNLISIGLTGSNLTSSIALFLNGAQVPGVLTPSVDKMTASFVVDGTVSVRGELPLVAKIGTTILKTILVVGDMRTYYNMSLAVSPVGGGTVTGAGSFVAGSSVPISASAASGYRFLQWSDGNMNASRSVVLNENTTLTAQFESLMTPISYGSSGNSRILVNGELEPANVLKGSARTIEPQLSGAETFSSWHLTNLSEENLDLYLASPSSSSTTMTIPEDYSGDMLVLNLNVN